MGITRQQSPVAPEIDILIARGVAEGCLELSEISDLIADQHLSEDDADALFRQLEEQGIEVSDDCGRDVSEQVSYVNDALAEKTTNALDLFFADVRRFPLLSAD